ncbi:MAG TPA: hypothetical protein VMH38_03790 [Thermoplasmata archaeon]|nr:hypothetical protein [Thermoplasmata archaeon]
MGPAEPLSSRMRAAVVLLCLFLAAVVGALVITVVETSPGVRFLASVVVLPIIVLTVVCLYFCRRRNVWGFAGAAVLGILGLGLRLAISTQPSLEVGGGLPIWVTALYVTLGALVAIWSVGSILELRGHSTPR